MIMRLQPHLLLEQSRAELIELQHYGYIAYCDKHKNIKTLGKTNRYPFFHRSAAKPLQACVIKDFKTKAFYNLTDEEIAVCCASHTGEPVHVEIIQSILAKAGLSEKDLKCPAIEPLNKEEQKKHTKFSPLHNNCSGKHTLMLAICAQMGWDTTNYLEKNSPIQIAIQNKIQKLCERKEEMPFTLDGCTAPNWATSLEELTVGFYNIFCTQDYCEIKDTFLKYPYLIGGKDRPDTDIMKLNHYIAAKAGAGGLLCVANTHTKEVLTIKVIDADMNARSVIAVEAMKQLDWIDINSIDKALLDAVCNTVVVTETGIPVGEYKCAFDIRGFNRKS